MSKKVLAYHGIRVPGFVTYRPGEAIAPASGAPLPAHREAAPDATPRPGSPRRRWCRIQAALAERVAMMHERFDQPAIAEEFVDGRELYVSLHRQRRRRSTSCRSPRWCSTSGRTRPEERIATQFAKWDEDYRARKGIRNVFARPLARGGAGADRGRSAGPPSGPSGCGTTPGSTSGSRPTARSGSSRPTPTPSSATGTTWPTRRRRPAWTTTEFIQRLVDEAMARYEHA